MDLGTVSHVENVVDLEMVTPVEAGQPVSAEVSASARMEMAEAK